ncbi:hypothetical protein [Proteus mirabilis]|uniref:hypothetical protein n=1 Tax=Proteus mirabilis TaxID=584 RepID=UPI0016289A74|nr:hypothetical protein [Proteus mirabilis]MBB6707136.1 hypothetical protein [Proteus mirabilis]
MEKYRRDLKDEVLNCRKANFDGIRQELSKADWVQMFVGKGTTGKWEAFRNEITRIQRKYIPVRVKGKAGRYRECWMTKEIEGLVKKKKEAYVRYRQDRSSESLEEYKGSRSILKREIRRMKRGHEIALANRIKENPK